MKEKYIARTQGERIQLEILENLEEANKKLSILIELLPTKQEPVTEPIVETVEEKKETKKRTKKEVK